MEEDERKLFEAFVALRRKDARSAEQAPVDGISERTLRRYLKEKYVPKRLGPSTRVAMARYLTSHGQTGYEQFLAAGVARKHQRNGRDDDIQRRLDDIEASDMDETLKIVKMESLAAIVRADQARYEARAAVIRARAIDRAEGSAEIRARAIAETNALQRFLALGSEVTPESEDQLRTFLRLLREAAAGDQRKAGENPG